MVVVVVLAAVVVVAAAVVLVAVELVVLDALPDPLPQATIVSEATTSSDTATPALMILSLLARSRPCGRGTINCQPRIVSESSP